MGFWRGVGSIGEGFYSMFSWVLPSPELMEDLDIRRKKMYEKYGWTNETEEWYYSERLIPTLPEPQQAKTPIRCPARKYNRR